MNDKRHHPYGSAGRAAAATLGVCIALLCGGCGGGSEDAHLQVGLDLIAKGSYQEAVPHLERAARKRSGTGGATAYCNLGIARWKLGQTDAAVDMFTIAADLASGDPRPYELMALALRDAGPGRWGAARLVLQDLNTRFPDQPRILCRMAGLEFAAGDTDLAEQHLQRALQLNADYAPALYNMAVIKRDRRNDLKSAIDYFRKYITVAPKDAHAATAVAEIKRLITLRTGAPPPRPPVETEPPPPPPDAAGQVPETPAAEPEPPAPVTPPAPVPPPAPPAAGPAVAPAPPPPVRSRSPAEPLLFSARKAIERQDYEDALILLNQAVAADRKHADSLWLLAQVYETQVRNATKAAAAYRKFAQLFPEDPRAAAAGRKAGADSPAQAKPRDASRDAARANWTQAVEAHRAGRLDDAIVFYKRALDADPNLAEAAYNLGLIHKSKRDLELARAYFERAAAANREMVKAHYMLGVVYRDLGEREKAIASAQAALRIDPRHGSSHFLLGLLYRESFRIDSARRHFSQAVQYAADEESRERAQTMLDDTLAAGAAR